METNLYITCDRSSNFEKRIAKFLVHVGFAINELGFSGWLKSGLGICREASELSLFRVHLKNKFVYRSYGFSARFCTIFYPDGIIGTVPLKLLQVPRNSFFNTVPR